VLNAAKARRLATEAIAGKKIGEIAVGALLSATKNAKAIAYKAVDCAQGGRLRQKGSKAGATDKIQECSQSSTAEAIAGDIATATEAPAQQLFHRVALLGAFAKLGGRGSKRTRPIRGGAAGAGRIISIPPRINKRILPML
jgi:hypothetical protein